MVKLKVRFVILLFIISTSLLCFSQIWKKCTDDIKTTSLSRSPEKKPEILLARNGKENDNKAAFRREIKLKEDTINLKHAVLRNDERNAFSKEIKLQENMVKVKHAVLLRRSKNNLAELWYSLEREYNSLREIYPNSDKMINQSFVNVISQLQAAIADVEELFFDLNKDWKIEEAEKLQQLVQSRLHRLQNPDDCNNAKQLLCNLGQNCGFGCEIHRLSYCLMVAYQLQRTLILYKVDWKYNDQWEEIFLPLSERCQISQIDYSVWTGEESIKNKQAVVFQITHGMVRNPPRTGIPEDLADRLLRLHGDSHAWWNGQMLKYIMRMQPNIAKIVKEFKQKNGFQHPCVGLHIRRSDKVESKEAAFHSLDEYMKHVIAWYDRYELKLAKETSLQKVVRRVFIATDDISVISEAKEKYPMYVFFYQSNYVSDRFEKRQLQAAMIDITVLSQCDYITCTFSSGFCRVAYELMQTYHPDASDFAHSLDDAYYYSGQTSREERAIYPHLGNKIEIDVAVGDVISFAGNHWNGFSKGTNKRTEEEGLYPSYKTETIFETVKCTEYTNRTEKILQNRIL